MTHFDLEKARAVDIDLLAATDWGELRARYRAALAEIERMRAIIDTPPEEGEWISDLKVIDRSTGSGLIDIEIAKKWHAAYRKAQNSNLLRKQEIERLRARDKQAAAAIVAMAEGAKQYVLKNHASMKNVFDEADSLAGYCEELENIVIAKDVRIKELKADLEQSERVIEARLDVIDQQAAKIKELEDALAEERVIGEGGFRAGQCEFWYIEDLLEESCMELDGPCDWATCPKKQELRDIAREQLAEEGKIGPDDSKKISHLRPYEVVAADLAGMLAKSWQITDERKAALSVIGNMKTLIVCPHCKTPIEFADIPPYMAVLRGMLAEVTR